MIQRNKSATLSWVGSTNATFKLLWSTQTQDVSNVRSWTSPGLTNTTTFILEVTAQEGGQTVKLYFSLTVIVANPSFTANDLTVLTTSTLEGAVTVGQTSAAAKLVVNGDVNPTGSVNAGANLNAAGNLAVQGNMTGGGSLTLPGGWVFSVDTSGNLNLSHNGTMQFQVSPTGGVTMPGQSLTFGPWTIGPGGGAGPPIPDFLSFQVGDNPGIA